MTALEIWDEASENISDVDEINHIVPILMRDFALYWAQYAYQEGYNAAGPGQSAQGSQLSEKEVLEKIK